MKSIYFRNFIVTSTMVFACFLIIAVAFAYIGRSYVVDEYRHTMQVTAAEAADMAGAISDTEGLDSWNLSMTLSAIGKCTQNHIFITDASGVICSCSDNRPMCEHIGNTINIDSLGALVPDGEFSGITDLDGFYPNMRHVVAVTVTDRGGNVIGYSFVTSGLKQMLTAWTGIQRFIFLVAVVVVSAAILVSFFYSKKMAEPLDEMAEASRKYARGDFTVRVRQQEDVEDEMGALIEAFNTMADSLEKAESRRSEFIANISHELRTPMTTISGFVDGILDGTIPREDEEKYLRSIRDETRRLSRLVREMLDVSRMKAKAADPANRTIFDLSELVLQTMLSFESRASKKSLDVDPQLPDNHILVRADRDAITQVIYNLMDNAVKFATPASCITVKLYKQGGKAYVAIKDVGETIPHEDLPYIFDRFHKSDRSRSIDKTGVGLGLYLVKQIINSHDEDIAVKSENGVTEFVFTLPLA